MLRVSVFTQYIHKILSWYQWSIILALRESYEVPPCLQTHPPACLLTICNHLSLSLIDFCYQYIYFTCSVIMTFYLFSTCSLFAVLFAFYFDLFPASPCTLCLHSLSIHVFCVSSFSLSRSLRLLVLYSYVFSKSPRFLLQLPFCIEWFTNFPFLSVLFFYCICSSIIITFLVPPFSLHDSTPSSHPPCMSFFDWVNMNTWFLCLCNMFCNESTVVIYFVTVYHVKREKDEAISMIKKVTTHLFDK